MTTACRFDECDEFFEKTKHNQVYHSDECRRLATNKRLMERYYEQKEQKARKLAHPQTCACGTVISRYNEAGRCFQCISSARINNEAVLGRVLGI